MPVVEFVPVGAMRLSFVLVEMRDGNFAALERDNKQKSI